MAEHKEEVVISGIGGLFPESNNIEELKDLLFKKMNAVTMDSKRWDQKKLGVSISTGKIKNVENFDAAFFNIHPKLAAVTDLLTSLSLERSIEAIVDAGLSPADLNGTNTGVFMSSTLSETEVSFYNSNKDGAFSLLGQNRSMQANRLSYILNLTGPSFSMNGNWVCSSNSLEKAKAMIEEGSITSAIVGVCSLCLTPDVQYQYHGLNRLNKGTTTKPFSVDADGYNRSEACIVLLLQRASEAKRSYGTLLSVKSVQFGDHYGHITEHNKIHFKSLLIDSYKNVNVDPHSVEYIEAYGSGIKCDDNVELDVIDEVFCTEQRKTPLNVGSVKSNVGHCEASGLFMSIVKAIIALDSGYIPPNINYLETNESHATIKNGKIHIVTEKTPLVNDIIGISSFGLANAFSHVILKRNNKIKFQYENNESNECIPRLILTSGRNEEKTRESLKIIMKHGHDAEFLALTYDVFAKNISNHYYRSSSLFPSPDESRIHNVWEVNLQKRPVWFIFSGMGSQWHGMGSHLMKLPIFANAINKCDAILKPRGVDIKYILTSLDQNLFDNILNSFVGIAAIQIGLVDVLKALDIVPDNIVGHSVGELGCAYADGCFTAEEMLLSAYARGRASLETNLIPGMMAAIGLGYHQIKDRLPHDIDVACHNSDSSCTLSGPVDSIDKFVSQLQSEGVFAKSVNVAGIAFHSRYIQAAGPTLLKYLREVIKTPKLRSAKWLSTSLPETEWNSELSKYSSAEYHTNNLLNSVLFEDALKHIPSNAIAIEIAPHGLLQAIIKKALPVTVSNIPLTKRMYGDSIHFLLNAIGRMYTCGINPKIQEIYPKITFPVSRGTPTISTLPIWNHTEKWLQQDLLNSLTNKKTTENYVSLILSDEIHLIEYQIHGHHIIPTSFFLYNIWKLFAEFQDKTMTNNPVKFQNLWFKNNIEIHPTRSSKNYVMIQPGTGLFEYSIDDEVVFSGQICFMDQNDFIKNTIQPFTQENIHKDHEVYVFKDEIYELLENNGYCLGDNYKNIIKFENSEKNIYGCVKWINDWIYFLDGLLKFTLLEDLEAHLFNAPISIREIKIDPVVFHNITEKEVNVTYNKATNEINCTGIKISDVKNGIMHGVLQKISPTVVKLEEKMFVHFNHNTWRNIDDFINDFMHIILEVDGLNLETDSEKLICTSYYNNDSISNACTKSLKQILENQLFTNTLSITEDNIKNTSKYDESGRFIAVTDDYYLLDTIKVLANKGNCYIFVSSDQKLQNFKNWKIIMQQKFNNIRYLTLIKKDKVLNENNIFVKDTCDDYDMSIWRTLDKYNSSTRVLYIISNSEPLEGIQNYVKNMLTKYKTHKLRFLFVLDKNATEFDHDKSFYENQLVKGFLINIYKNGGWGFYKRVFVKEFKNNMKISDNTTVNRLKIESKIAHTIKYIGFNYKDLVAEDNIKNELGPLDYSAILENGKVVMGIATYEQKTSKVNHDSILLWSVPSTWSFEEATTVPLTYAMSYYVFNILCSLQKKMSILITSGLHPIGYAAIAISLAKKCEIYVIVESSQDAEQLSKKFPELPRSRILANTNDNFDVQILMMTKSKGVNLVLNFLSGEAFQAALRTTLYSGKFFHFADYSYDTITHGSMGSRFFLNNTSFSVVVPSMLLNESDHNKRMVGQAFMDGLSKGVIKPFPIFDMTSLPRKMNIFDTMRTSFTISPLQKVVLSLDNILGNSNLLTKSECDVYHCQPEQVHVIVANRIDWLDVADWLVNRGAKNIVVVVESCLMSSFHGNRFNRLISLNLSIHVEPDVYLKTNEESLNWLNRLTSLNDLGLMFIVNQWNDKKIKNLQYAFEENKKKTKMSSFVCMSSNGDQSCADLKSIGLNALNIYWNDSSSQPKNVSSILHLLDTLLLKSNTKTSSSFVCSEKASIKLEWSNKMNAVIENYFPVSIIDVHCLNEIIRKNPGFVEVQTRSPRLSQMKSVVPVFVIPGFRPKLFEEMYKQFYYPVFEARFPEHFGSIDELSEILVNELKQISNSESVSLIGESWGGVVALKMAQMLEAQGILVSISLLNGNPKFVTDWAKYILSEEYFAKKLNTIYNSYFDEQTKEEKLKLFKVSVHKKTLQTNMNRALNWILSTLKILLDNTPLPNKLQTKVFMFNYERMAEIQNPINDLIDYSINPPRVHIVHGNDYKHMMVDRKMIKLITKIVVYSLAVGNKIPLSDKYKKFYFNKKKLTMNTLG